MAAAPCKFDAFKVRSGQETAEGTNLTVVTDANPAFTREFNWKIEKSVDASHA